jgi:hypothetical protein
MDPKAEDRKRREEGRLEIIKARADTRKRRRTSSIDESLIPHDETTTTGKKVIDIKSTSWKSIIATGKERKSGAAVAKSEQTTAAPANDFFLSFDSAPL